jgi:mannosyltransferase OCH1-like enzyme
MIPKIIHQTFKTKKLPLELQEVVFRFKDTCPTFEHRLYDDDDMYNFIKDNYDEETLSLYNMINPKLGMARADFFRYLLIYKVGGFYFDIKSCTERDLTCWAENFKFITAHWCYRNHSDTLNYELGEFQNWHIISEPGHPILELTITRMKENIRNYVYQPDKVDHKTDVLNVTGPLCYSRAILETKDKYKDGYLVFQCNEHLGLIYDGVTRGHHSVYTGYLDNEPVVIK